MQEAFERFTGPSVPAELTPELREVYAKAAAQRLELIGDRMQLVDLFISPSAFLRQKFIDVGMTRPDQPSASVAAAPVSTSRSISSEA